MPPKPSGEALHLVSRVAVGLLAIALIYGTGAPLLRSDAWWIRIFDFPRLQLAVLLGVTLAAYAALRRWGRLQPWEHALAAVAGLALVWQLISIAPYTPLYPTEMADSRAGDDSNRISFLIFNVLDENREVEPLRNLIRDTDPDIILLSEPTQWWLEQLDGLESDYPFTVFQPQENTYGKLLYSRLALEDPEIRFLIDSEIPSIRTKVHLRSGAVVTLYGVHPRPPGLRRSAEEDREGHGNQGAEEGPQLNGEREDSDMRDAELLLVAKEVKKLGDAPAIVAGDFNDVAWSHTTRLFQRIGGLLDPRVGRGLINTFDARSRVLRYPLDHLFASPHFSLVELRRLPDIGSDHFPLLVVLDYDPDASVFNEKPQPQAGDEQEAEEAIVEGDANH
jgi:endonuclease/exonuclease/phosphatase (EEP) superfamily protein YafD